MKHSFVDGIEQPGNDNQKESEHLDKPEQAQFPENHGPREEKNQLDIKKDKEKCDHEEFD